MDQDWTRKAARDAAMHKAIEAAALLRDAKSIFHANDYDVDALNLGEALEYIEEVTE